MTGAPLDLKISVQIPDDYVDALESYFYECDPNPWVLIKKTAAGPYYLSGYFNREGASTQAIDALKKNFPNLALAFDKEKLIATELSLIHI